MYLLGDQENSNHFPWVNYLLIALNCIVFALETNAASVEGFIHRYAFTPVAFNALNPVSYIPVFTSMFLHADILHIGFNMWSLYVFGDNIETKLGHLWYLALYLTGGFIATMTHYLFNRGSDIQVLGASGAIAAVMGMYFIFFGENTVRVAMRLTISFNNPRPQGIPVKAWIYLGFWFITQLVYSIFTPGAGIAWFAHIGGFAFGFLYADLTDKTDDYPWNKHITIKLGNIFGEKKGESAG